MRPSDFLRLGRTGSAGVLATLLLGGMAEAALPTGGMMLPRPRGPARADLPSYTSIAVRRVPSGTAYGLTGAASDEPAASSDDPFANETAAERPAPERHTAKRTVTRPAVHPRFVSATSEDNPFAAAAEKFTAEEPFVQETAAHAGSFAGEPGPRPPIDAWEETAAAISLTEAAASDVEHEYGGLKGICPVTLRDERRVVEPRPELFSEHAGRRYEFATPEAKVAFDADPKRYAPVLGGRDVVLTAAGEEDAVGTLKYAGVYRERLYLFRTAESCKDFYENPRRFMIGG